MDRQQLDEIINQYFLDKGLLDGSFGSIQSPLGYLERALQRRTQQFKSLGTVTDLDSFSEYRDRAFLLEFKLFPCEEIPYGQLGCLRWHARRGAWVFFIEHDELGIFQRIRCIHANGSIQDWGRYPNDQFCAILYSWQCGTL